MSKRVYVGMSGGVDSSLTAALLRDQGWDVTGVYMKNWSKDLPGYHCPWRQDFQDAKRVAVQLGIPFTVYDFEAEYRQRVVDYLLREYQAGRTPNPDIMCNQEIKFGLFFETARAQGADMIAMGHYARTSNGQLLTAVDPAKDQTYFLYRVTADALKYTLLPIGEFASKAEVRRRASHYALATADKKDSQGICFVGEIGIKDFLLSELGPQTPGDIVDKAGNIVGQHDGAIFYTIGQRHGLQVGGGLPYYVTRKDMAANIVYVSTDLDDRDLWRRSLSLSNTHWINGAPEQGKTYLVRARYRSPLVAGRVESVNDDSATILLDEDIRAITAGQSAVMYDGEVVLGGGIIG